MTLSRAIAAVLIRGGGCLENSILPIIAVSYYLKKHCINSLSK